MRPGSIYRRFYLYTLLLCALTVLFSFAAITLGRHGEWRDTMHRLSKTVGGVAAISLQGHLEDGQAPQILSDLSERFTVNISLLDPSGKRLAFVGAELPPPAQDELDAARTNGFSGPPPQHRWLPPQLEGLLLLTAQGPGRWLLIPIPRAQGNAAAGADQLLGYLQVSPLRAREKRATNRLALLLGATLLLVALLMLPATRAVTRPLTRLTASARRFAEGDFAHRVPVEGPREIAHLGAEMNEMAQRLATLLHTQRQLLADVSHELRSPLARIEVALELARGAGVGAAPLDSIQGDVAELRQLIADILTNSRLELRPDLLRHDTFAPGEVLSEARDKAVASGIDPAQLRLEDTTAGAEVKGDPELIRHALGNLVDNARKHAPSDRPVVLGARPEGDRVLLFVRDQGPGIPADELPRLFEPFYRTDNSRARQSGGAGLGLSLVRRIAELHGGPPYVVSTPGQGSTFGVTLERVS